MIEHAYRPGESEGLAVWVEDEAGPYPAIPQAGQGGCAEGAPTCQPHEYVRGTTAKLLTLFHPATGELHAQGVTSSANAILHPWLASELATVLARWPVSVQLEAALNRQRWQAWQAGLSVKFTLPDALPPLRALLVLDNLTGHKTPAFVLGLVAQGVMPLDTPLSGSWLNMAESVQRIIARRALAGTHMEAAEETIAALEATVRGWNRCPTPFMWGGERARARRHGHTCTGTCPVAGAGVAWVVLARRSAIRYIKTR